MPTWMEKIRDRLATKENLKSLFIELQPDNRVSTIMVVSYVPTDKDSFPVFMDLIARIAMDQKTVPDNLLLHFEGIPAGDIPFTGKLPVEDSEKALRFIVSHGGITENNSVPLRKATYLRACQKELTAENFQALDTHRAISVLLLMRMQWKRSQQGNRPNNSTQSLRRNKASGYSMTDYPERGSSGITCNQRRIISTQALYRMWNH